MFLVVLGGLALLLLVFWSFTRKDRRKPPPVRKTAHSAPRQRPSTVPTRDEVFDSGTAVPVAKPQVLKGPAYVIDGDSIVIAKTQIRLFGIDAPELNHPFGQKAKWALVALTKGQTVHAEIRATDVHGRTVAFCSLPDGRDLSAEMVRQGLAIDWAKFSGGVYRAMETADARKKLWLADARQKGRMHVWAEFEAKKSR